MKYSVIALAFTIGVIASTLIQADMPAGSVYLEGSNNKTALILIHGRGKHPEWKVVDPLRKGVNQALGYHTLSLQVPNEDKNWRKYAEDFPRAYEIVNKAIRFLKEEKAVTAIYLMGHSMGSRMASAFLAESHNQQLSGLIIAGCRNNGGYPLSCDENIQILEVPVLDIWGGGDNKDSKAASERATRVSTSYEQREIPGANHRFEGYEKEFVLAVIDWLTRQNENRHAARVDLNGASANPYR